MIKKCWKTLLITSIVILLPILAGLYLWDQLPELIPAHWNAAGEVDGWSSKPFAVFGMPLILLGFQWICALGTAADPKKRNHPEKILHLVLWIIPVLNLLLSTITYTSAMGSNVPVEIIIPEFMGLLFIIIGNYMPKCKQNYTIGIKIPWTLNSEENWNKTHRFAGILWVICGALVMICALLGNIFISLALIFPMVFLPLIYSYILHRKGI